MALANIVTVIATLCVGHLLSILKVSAQSECFSNLQSGYSFTVKTFLESTGMLCTLKAMYSLVSRSSVATIGIVWPVT